MDQADEFLDLLIALGYHFMLRAVKLRLLETVNRPNPVSTRKGSSQEALGSSDVPHTAPNVQLPVL